MSKRDKEQDDGRHKGPGQLQPVLVIDDRRDRSKYAFEKGRPQYLAFGVMGAKYVTGPARFAGVGVHEVDQQAFGQNEKEAGNGEDDVEKLVDRRPKGGHIGRQPPAGKGRDDEQSRGQNHDHAKKYAPPLLHKSLLVSSTCRPARAKSQRRSIDVYPVLRPLLGIGQYLDKVNQVPNLLGLQGLIKSGHI